MAFLAPLITWGGVATTAATVGAGVLLSNATKSDKSQLPSIPQPTTPDTSAVAAKETEAILKANQRRTRTILTSPLGETDQSQGTILKKTLGGY